MNDTSFSVPPGVKNKVKMRENPCSFVSFGSQKGEVGPKKEPLDPVNNA